MEESITAQNPVEEFNNNIPVRKRKPIKLILFIIIAVLVITMGASTFFLTRDIESSDTVQSPIAETADNQVLQSISPTPYEFQELTIPYLRIRSYESTMGEREQISQNSDYTSYLTSYTSDGLRINALLTRPTGQMPEGGWPAVVFVHGYIPPANYATNGQSYSSYVDYLAKNGIVVLKIDLRGHGESEGEPGGAYYSSDYIVDTLSAYDALQDLDFVNPQAIGLWGHSMAGNVVLRSMVVKPEIKAGVIWAGAVYTYQDMREYGIQDSSYQPSQNPRRSARQSISGIHGDPASGSAFWKELAPVHYVGDMKGVVHLHHATDDNVVSIEYSRNLMKYLESVSSEHKLFEYPSGGHNISGSSFVSAMNRTVEFYIDNLL